MNVVKINKPTEDKPWVVCVAQSTQAVEFGCDSEESAKRIKEVIEKERPWFVEIVQL